MNDSLPRILAKLIDSGEDDIIGACRCGARWAGGKVCHCSSCHSTFASVRGFDFHRRGRLGERMCHKPSDLGMTLDALKVWRLPVKPDSPQWFKTRGR